MGSRSPEPVSCIKRASIPDRIGMYKCWFLEKGKSGVPGEKLLRAEKRANNKLDLHDNAGLVGGEFPHHYTIPAPQDHSKGFGSTCQMGSDLCIE